MPGENILVVDNNTHIADICKRFLKRKYNVDLATSGEEALKMCNEKAYRVMLLDLKMQGMNGLDVLRWVKKNYANCAVVIMTVYATQQIMKDIVREGCEGYLEKPFELAELDAIVKSALENGSKKKEVLAGKKILVVDDEEELSEFFRMVFELNKAEVITVSDGKAALEKVEQEKPDLVLLDIMLPGISGFEICRKIKNNEQFKNIQVIFLTSRVDEKDRIKAIEAGANAFFMKSINPQVLISEVEKLFAKK